MIQVQNTKSFIQREKLYNLISDCKSKANSKNVQKILKKSLNLKGLSLEDVAILLNVEDENLINNILQHASIVKKLIYGNRLVLFAPLYIANYCSNNCLYCGFRKDNKEIDRAYLSLKAIEEETLSLLKEGHKRILMLMGESENTNLDYFLKAIRKVYEVSYHGNKIRRINVEIAPLSVDDFKRLKNEHIGTYACFQETYDKELYKKYHPEGPKSDYLWRLYVMDRAMEAGIDDVGIGALFGLADYRFEVLALLEHAKHLEKKFGCGPHTISIPRIEPAKGAPLSNNVPFPVSDKDFKKLVAILRLAVPYTGIILSTRESESLRNELFNYVVSQISAGSRTNPGAYSNPEKSNNGQFSLGDHRTLEEVISALIDGGFIPSFCTSCYRKGRVGKDFMDLAKPGLIKKFCTPNGILSFVEYLINFANNETKNKGFELVNRMIDQFDDDILKNKTKLGIEKLINGNLDIYF